MDTEKKGNSDNSKGRGEKLIEGYQPIEKGYRPEFGKLIETPPSDGTGVPKIVSVDIVDDKSKNSDKK